METVVLVLLRCLCLNLFSLRLEAAFDAWEKKSPRDQLSGIAAEIRSNPAMFPEPKEDVNLTDLDPEEQLKLAIELSKKESQKQQEQSPMTNRVRQKQYVRKCFLKWRYLCLGSVSFPGTPECTLQPARSTKS